MLVLSRKKDQKIVIADEIEIMVIEIRGDKVRLGIKAPGDVSVDREEIWAAKKAEYERERKRDVRGGMVPPASPASDTGRL